MNTSSQTRGFHWFNALVGEAAASDQSGSVVSVTGDLAGAPCQFLLVHRDPNNHFPRAQQGEVGLLEGIGIAKAINQIIEEDQEASFKRSIIAVVDVPSQAYGKREEALGIHQALSSAVSAYARARLAGHKVVALLVGKAMSGAFLAHGYQANRIVALNNSGVMVHAMGKAAAARITQRTPEELDILASDIPPMAYDLNSYASLGLVDALIDVDNVDDPTNEDVDSVLSHLAVQLESITSPSIARRLQGENRECSRKVRNALREQWSA